MASNKLLMLSVVAIFIPAMAMATDYIVGDDSGWTINFDYQAWAKDKVFYVGDKLVFQYPKGYHNVFKVNGTAFKNCDIPPTNQALSSGNDTVVLNTPGRKWYICGVSNHCSAYAQKLFITVQYQYGWAPAATPQILQVSQPWAATPAPTPSSPSTPAPTPSVPDTIVTDPWASSPITSSPPLPTPIAPSWPPAPSLPTTPAPTPEPWAPTTLSVPETTVTDPWAPAPAPWAPSPISSPPSLPTPTAPSWPPAPSPYPWI
ncbi:hypothetical protein ERO13_D11G243850v2 [Gossypium hirsutum]|uniref:Blue copper protein 1a n=2 Tax=Gossypium TaxID=3633 RepID=A0A1U8JWY1_GOSHI|nr:blue copper protein 1a-like [Gossypium hirsutum]KAB2005330.1 hypothetical protein ES319_D11G262800v1 [Gossypium barbadense]KAG4122052.1 hypothetical protein ERO13_D11G243850v2 [Gossypium hirsutum]PPD87490.1 hypothetical protein GOBAR_DD15576 [Gossypium barbadense]